MGATLTAGERHAMLEDIGRVAFTLGQAATDVAPEDAFLQGVISASPAPRLRPDAITSPLERLAFLLALWQQYQPALAAILRGPDARMQTCPQDVFLARSRGDKSAAQGVARLPRPAASWQRLNRLRNLHAAPDYAKPAFLVSPPGCEEEAGRLGRTRLPESAAVRSHDTWANRMTATLLTDIAREAGQLGRLAGFCGAEQEAVQALQLVSAANRFRAHVSLRSCPLLALQEATPQAGAAHILRCPPPYQAVYQGWRLLHHPLDFDWTQSPFLTLPALEAWRLYEIWCLLQVAAALLQSGWQLTGNSLLRPSPRGLRLLPATGRASRLEFSKTRGPLFLYYQPLFASANQRGAAENRTERDFDFCSRSHAMQPDIVLHWQGRLFVLDPKFKPYAQSEDAQDDVNKMHAYRDAIVRRGAKTSGANPAVAAAWCLFPGPLPDKGGEPTCRVYAYPAAAPQNPFGTAGVGALQLRSGSEAASHSLSALLAFLLQD